LTADCGASLVRPRAEGRPSVAALPFESGGDFGFVDELQPSEGTREGAVSVALRRLSSEGVSDSSYLVDPASSHMLVSKIKPCMSKYKQICTVKLRMAH
jgi:hypothetical protein